MAMLAYAGDVRGRRARDRAVARPRHADRRHGPPDALSRAVPGREPERLRRPPRRARCSSIASTAARRRRSSTPRALDGAAGGRATARPGRGRWRGCPPTRPPSRTADRRDHGDRRGDATTAPRSGRARGLGRRTSRRELRAGDDGAYAGFLGDAGRRRGARPRTRARHWDRLAAIKAAYDPGNRRSGSTRTSRPRAEWSGPPSRLKRPVGGRRGGAARSRPRPRRPAGRRCSRRCARAGSRRRRPGRARARAWPRSRLVRALADVVHQRHAVAARVGDAGDVHDDDRAVRLGHLERLVAALLEQPGEALVAGGHDLAAPVQAQDPRRALERAQHHDDAAVLADVGDRLGAAADHVEVGDGVVVEHLAASRSGPSARR